MVFVSLFIDCLRKNKTGFLLSNMFFACRFCHGKDSFTAWFIEYVATFATRVSLFLSRQTSAKSITAAIELTLMVWRCVRNSCSHVPRAGPPRTPNWKRSIHFSYSKTITCRTRIFINFGKDFLWAAILIPFSTKFTFRTNKRFYASSDFDPWWSFSEAARRDYPVKGNQAV